MKRFILTVLLILLLSLSVTAEKTISFSDLPESHWAYSTVMPMVEKGLFNGTSAVVDGVGTFSPDKAMTRGEFLAVVCREYFKDEIYAPATGLPWWDPYFTIAVKNNFFDYSREFLDLNITMTRGEAALLIVRVMQAVGNPLTNVMFGNISDFESVQEFDKDFYHGANFWGDITSAVQCCVGEGIIGGVDSKGTFDPYGKLTRAAAATIICRLYDETKRVEPFVPANIQKRLDDCVKGNHYFTGNIYRKTVSGRKPVEEIKVATPEEEGLYRINCVYCDYYVEVPFRKHNCFNSPSLAGDIKLSCGEHHWQGGKCVATSTATGIKDAEHHESGYDVDITMTCAGTVSSTRYRGMSKEDATHDYTGWRVVSFPGKGVEGRVENVCTKCGDCQFKILPMYSSDETKLDVRLSYSIYEMNSVRPYNDTGRSVERVKADFTRSLDDNQSIFSEFLFKTDGRYLHQTYGITSNINSSIPDRNIGRLTYDKSGTRWGVNIFDWREGDQKSIHFMYKQMGMELLYFLVKDREIAFALSHLVELHAVEGRAAMTDKAIDSFGFETLNRTDSSLMIAMKNTTITFEWGSDIKGFNMFFGSITRNV